MDVILPAEVLLKFKRLLALADGALNQKTGGKIHLHHVHCVSFGE